MRTQSNPAGGTIDSNPFKIARLGGNVVVADAGGNAIIQVDDGVLSTFAVFPNRVVPGPGGAPIPMQPVPTSVAEGPDGALYVGQLTGFPFPVGGAAVFRVVQGSEPEVFADGFTNIIDIAFDREGALYVLQISKNGLLSGNPVGALIKVSPGGEREELFPGALIAPGGMTIGRDGSIYVTRFATLPTSAMWCASSPERLSRLRQRGRLLPQPRRAPILARARGLSEECCKRPPVDFRRVMDFDMAHIAPLALEQSLRRLQGRPVEESELHISGVRVNVRHRPIPADPAPVSPLHGLV